MTQQQIIEESNYLAIQFADADIDVRDAIKTGFQYAVNWRIDSVWHDASEKPDKNQLVLFEVRKTYGKGYSVNFGENYSLLKNVLLAWAYIIDLLPERKEARDEPQMD